MKSFFEKTITSNVDLYENNAVFHRQRSTLQFQMIDDLEKSLSQKDKNEFTFACKGLLKQNEIVWIKVFIPKLDVNDKLELDEIGQSIINDDNKYTQLIALANKLIDNGKAAIVSDDDVQQLGPTEGQKDAKIVERIKLLTELGIEKSM